MRSLLPFVLICSVIFPLSAADETIYSYALGDFEVHLLVENRGEGRASILLGADQETMNRYVPGGVYQSETNTYLIKTGSQNILIDTGFGTTIFQSLRTLGLSPADIDVVLLTHLHGDHIGGLQRDGAALFPRARVYLSQREREYWTEVNANPSAVSALGAYPSRVTTFVPGELGTRGSELLPGIRAIAAYGHTPGHTVFAVESRGQQLLILGDLLHVEDIQFPLPGVTVTYDTDPAAAEAIRQRFFSYAALNSVLIGGMHLRYPAMGQLRAVAQGYQFLPLK